MKDYMINVTKINVINGQGSIANQPSVKYYHCELSYKGVHIESQFHNHFDLSEINNINDAIRLVSSYGSRFGTFQKELFTILLAEDNIDFTFEVDNNSEYKNDYGRYTKLN